MVVSVPKSGESLSAAARPHRYVDFTSAVLAVCVLDYPYFEDQYTP